MHPTLRQGLELVTRLFSGPRPGGPADPRPKARRRVAPELSPLEERVLQYFSVDATVTPTTLWPPNGRYVPVTISGTFYEFAIVGNKQVVEHLPGPKKANFQVVDEYRQDEPFGPIRMVDVGHGRFSYSVTFNLQASRASEFTAGRRYYIVVGARDNDGWGTKLLTVQVPHDLKDRGPGPIPTLKSKLPPKSKPAPIPTQHGNKSSLLPFL